MAFLIAVLIAFALPKRVECGYPGGMCTHVLGKEHCTTYELEPWGFYWLEKLFKRDIGFAYKTGEDCRY